MLRLRNEAFFECLADYLRTELPNKGTRSKRTERTYRAGLNLFLDYLAEVEGVALAEVGFDNFDGDSMLGFKLWMLDHRKLSPQTARLRMTAVRSFVSYAVKKDAMGPLEQVEVFGVSMPKHQRKLVVPMADPAVKAVMEQPDVSTAIGYRDLSMMALMYDTAVRCQELADLRVCDLCMREGDEHVFVLGKGSKTRVVPLVLSKDHMEKYLAAFHPGALPGSDRPLFYPANGPVRHLSGSTVEKMVTKYAERARASCPEVPDRVYPHLFRHTRAMEWLSNGMPKKMIAELLGHADISTTDIYAKSDLSMKRKDMEKFRNARPPVGDTEKFWHGDEDIIRKLYGLA